MALCVTEECQEYNRAFLAERKERERERRKTYRQADSARAYIHAWREANPDKVRAYSKAWHEANLDLVHARSKAWREANPDKIRAYREANLDLERTRIKAYREANPDKIRAYDKAWREANPDKVRARRAAHQKANPEMYRAKNSRRRAIRKVAMSTEDRAQAVEWRKLIAGDACVYCGAPGEHDDHVMPLSKGGTDHWWNIERACAVCNLSKHDRCDQCFTAGTACNCMVVAVLPDEEGYLILQWKSNS
jgi:5-methylcytosine-specific restriction endonuclease McrA